MTVLLICQVKKKSKHIGELNPQTPLPQIRLWEKAKGERCGRRKNTETLASLYLKAKMPFGWVIACRENR